ncbi:MAG TPA: hypothetical protein DCY13_10065 [Verrucomicrobiales bacterium]|nr:hypothetical protein [Verrucomicrobiales bacterium]
MKSSLFRIPFSRLAPASLTLLAGALSSADAQLKLPPLEFEESEKAGYFFRFAGKALFNVRASVDQVAPTPQTPGNYDNGFVLPDIGGTASGLTWNWGFLSDDQIASDMLNFERYSNLPHGGAISGEKDDPLIGGELLFGVEFGRFDVGTREWAWGAEIGYGFNPFKISNRSMAAGTVDYLAASHALNGILPPVGPYSGTFEGPGPVIDLNPTSTTAISSAATSTFDGTLESSLHNFKFGFWVEAPVTQKFSVALSLGYSSILADSELSFRETFTFANPAIPQLADVDTSVTADGWRNGFYGQLRVNYEINQYLGAFVGGEFQYNNRFKFGGAGRNVTLDFTGIYSAVAGVSIDW